MRYISERQEGNLKKEILGISIPPICIFEPEDFSGILSIITLQCVCGVKACRNLYGGALSPQYIFYHLSGILVKSSGQIKTLTSVRRGDIIISGRDGCALTQRRRPSPRAGWKSWRAPPAIIITIQFPATPVEKAAPAADTDRTIHRNKERSIC